MLSLYTWWRAWCDHHMAARICLHRIFLSSCAVRMMLIVISLAGNVISTCKSVPLRPPLWIARCVGHRAVLELLTNILSAPSVMRCLPGHCHVSPRLLVNLDAPNTATLSAPVLCATGYREEMQPGKAFAPVRCGCLFHPRCAVA